MNAIVRYYLNKNIKKENIIVQLNKKINFYKYVLFFYLFVLMFSLVPMFEK